MATPSARTIVDDLGRSIALTATETAFLDALRSDFKYVVGDTVPSAERADDGADDSVRAAVLRHAIESRDGVTLVGARIVGSLNLAGADLTRHPFILIGCRLDDGIVTRGGSFDEILIVDCDVHGIMGDYSKFTSRLLVTNSRFDAPIDLHGSQIAGELAFDGGSIHLPPAEQQDEPTPHIALCGEHISVGEHVFVGNRFEVKHGIVSFDWASIRGQAVFRGAVIDPLETEPPASSRESKDSGNPGGTSEDPLALSLTGATLGGLYCDAGFQATGMVDLMHAKIQTQAIFANSYMGSPGAPSVRAEGLEVAGDVRFDNAMTVGEVKLARAKIDGQLHLGGFLTGDSIEYKLPNGHLLVRRQDSVPVDLRGAEVAALVSTDLQRVSARTSGLNYGELVPAVTDRDVGRLLTWLERDPDGFIAGSYTRLAGSFRARGYTGASRSILIRAEQRRRAGGSFLGRWFWSPALRAIMGYGYTPHRALWWLAAVAALGTIVSAWLAHPDGACVRTLCVDSPMGPAFQPAQSPHPPFSALLYAITAVVPLIDLGFSGWVPVTRSAQVTTAILSACGWFLFTGSSRFVVNGLL